MENTFYKKYLIKDGLVEYKKDNETLLIEKPVLDKSIKSIINKPVIITHDGENKVGEVVDAYYDIDTGNYIVGFNIWNEEAKKLLNNGYSISSTFEVINKEPATEKYHNIEYDNRVIDLEFINIAIVKEPRYQEAKQYVNSLDQDNIYENGGAGSGNWGHKGRKGLVGGSSKYDSEDYSEKDLSEIAKRKETKGIINKKSIIKDTIKNKVMNKLKKDKDLKERVEKFRKENFEKKETEKKEDIEEKDEVKYLKEKYKKLDKEIDEIEDKITKNREERQEIEKEFDKIPEATMTNFWVRNDMGNEIQHRLSAKEEESEEMIHKSVELREEQYKISEKIKEIEQREIQKQKDFKKENFDKKTTEKETKKDELKETEIKSNPIVDNDFGDEFNNFVNSDFSEIESFKDLLYGYLDGKPELGEKYKKATRKFLDKWQPMLDKVMKKEADRGEVSYNISKDMIDYIKNKGDYSFLKRFKEKFDKDKDVNDDVAYKDNRVENGLIKALKNKDIEKAKLFFAEKQLLVNAFELNSNFRKDKKGKYIFKDVYDELGINDMLEKNNKTKQATRQKAIKEVKTKANETYKNNGYDIEKDNSSYYFKDMKKKAILKYGKLENILNRDLDISDFESIAPYYSEIQNNSLEPHFTYWQSPDGKVKRVYYKLYSQGEEIKSGYEPIDDVFEDYITGNLKDDEKTKMVKDIRKMRKNKI